MRLVDHGGDHFSLRASSAAARRPHAVLQDLIRPLELTDLTLELGDPLRVIGGYPGR